MGHKQSRDQLLYQNVISGDVQGIRALYIEGASLEWKDEERRTSLMVAAKDSGLYGVAKILIELGANVNAYARGLDGGTPLHYAAKEGLDHTVALLLSHGANAFVRNDENQTPLHVARKNKHSIVARQIENHICYFAGHVRETFGPGLSDSSTSQVSSRVIWVVVVPRRARNPPRPSKVELVLYSTSEDIEPRKIVFPKRFRVKEPKFDQRSPAFVVTDKHSNTRYKFSSVIEGDKHQLRRLYNACKGISQVIPVTAQATAERLPSSLKTKAETVPNPYVQPPLVHLQPPSAPPVSLDHDSYAPDSFRRTHHKGPSHSVPIAANNGKAESCVICWEAPIEGACIPCGHVSSCMSCLNEILEKKGACPVCRSEIHQVVKLYGISNIQQLV